MHGNHVLAQIIFVFALVGAQLTLKPLNLFWRRVFGENVGFENVVAFAFVLTMVTWKPLHVTRRCVHAGFVAT
jgi:hypothetical protein